MLKDIIEFRHHVQDSLEGSEGLGVEEIEQELGGNDEDGERYLDEKRDDGTDNGGYVWRLNDELMAFFRDDLLRRWKVGGEAGSVSLGVE